MGLDPFSKEGANVMADFGKDEIVYAGFPSVLLMDRPGGKPVEHVIWGDWLRVLSSYFASGGIMEEREWPWRRALARQGFATWRE